MGYVTVSLKIPDWTDGHVVALTRIDSDGNTTSLGYVSRGELLVEGAMREHIGRMEGVGPDYALPSDWEQDAVRARDLWKA